MGFFNNLFFRNTTRQSMAELNPSAPVFDSAKIRDIESIVASKYSVIDADTNNFETDTATAQFNTLWYTPLITDKFQRIQAYRRMAMYPEVDWCISEIADDFIHEDQQGNVINLNLALSEEGPLTSERKKVLTEEFNRFIGLFKLKEEGYNLCKKFVVEGEVAFENIIDPKQPLKGIIGVKYLPTDFYENLIDPKTGRLVGIYFNRPALKGALERLSTQGYTAASNVFDGMVGGVYSIYNTENQIPMLWPQLTYISSGNQSPDGKIVYPMIDQAKQPYHQLALLHDAAVILRVTRAPERLVFNIATGGVSDKIAKNQVREFVNAVNSKRVLSEKDKMTTTYNPITMLESFYFWKSDANDGTSVESLGSTANYSEIDDIKYFLKRLFKQFKVPFSRYDTPENTLEKNDSITYEEYSFSRMILRIQRRFALAFKKSFITHLKLRGIWDQYALKESYIEIEMVRPVLYDLYQSQKLFNIQVENYETVANLDGMSKTVAMKKYLGMTDAEIEENRQKRMDEEMFNTLIEYYQDQLQTNGPESLYTIPPSIRWKTMTEQEGGEEGVEGGEPSEEEPETLPTEEPPE